MQYWRAHIVDDNISISRRLTGPERDACARFINSRVGNDLNKWLCRDHKNNVFLGVRASPFCR